MLKKILCLVLVFASVLIFGCAKKTTDTEKGDLQKSAEVVITTMEPDNVTDNALEDGTYNVEFKTDSSMFKLNESCKGKAVLTVKDGKMTVHITLISKKILNLFVGTAEDAQKEGAVLLEPTLDEVTYDDGETEEVYGFDVPVEVIGEEFDLAIVGEKGKWYDHKVIVENPVSAR